MKEDDLLKYHKLNIDGDIHNPMFTQNTSTDTKIAVLTERLSSFETLMKKIDEAIQLMGETNQNISTASAP